MQQNSTNKSKSFALDHISPEAFDKLCDRCPKCFGNTFYDYSNNSCTFLSDGGIFYPNCFVVLF